MTLSIATINVNGLRAAVRRGMDAWVAQVRPDVMALQEVRAPDEVVAPLLGDGWSHVGASSVLKGRAGVASRFSSVPRSRCMRVHRSRNIMP